jgi:hypothetical protein
MSFTDTTSPFHPSNIPKDMPCEFWEWMCNLHSKSIEHEKMLKEHEKQNKELQKKVEDLERENLKLTTYVRDLEEKVIKYEEGTSFHFENLMSLIQNIFLKQNESDGHIRGTQEVVERLLCTVSQVDDTIKNLTENFAITQDNYDTRIWEIQDSLDDLRERMRTEIRKKNKKDNDNENEL